MCAFLGINPIICHATTILYNWALIDPQLPVGLDNLRTLNTCTGCPDESWFYLISIATEAHGGGRLLSILFRQLNNASSVADIAATFNDLRILLIELKSIIERMYECNIPAVFYKRVRPYLAGWINDPKLPGGLFYGDALSAELYAGASVAQAAIFQAVDIALGIFHHTCGHNEESRETNVGLPGVYLREMRNYMPRSHRRFLEWLEDNLKIRPFVLRHSENIQLKEAYNAALHALEDFRTEHVKMVSVYVIAQANKDGDGTDIRGTGGSNPIPLLKTIRSHVTDALLP